MERKMAKIFGDAKTHGALDGEIKATSSFSKPIKMDLENVVS
jgi:hypothetical protein